jgi:hypothetical protein
MVANSIWNEILTVHKNPMWSSKVCNFFCILNSFNTKWVLILDILQVQFKNQSTIKFSSLNTQSCLLREFLLKFFKNFQHSIKNSNESSSHQFVRSEVHQTLLNFFKNSRKSPLIQNNHFHAAKKLNQIWSRIFYFLSGSCFSQIVCIPSQKGDEVDNV